MPREQSGYRDGPWPTRLGKFSRPEDDSVHLGTCGHTETLLSPFSSSDPKGSPRGPWDLLLPEEGEGEESLLSSCPPRSKHRQSCVPYSKGALVTFNQERLVSKEPVTQSFPH